MDTTWKKIETATRREIKPQMNSAQSESVRDQLRRKYSELVKKMTKLDKRKFEERLADETDVAAGTQDLNTLYRITKALNNG